MGKVELQRRGHATTSQGDMTLWQMLLWTYQQQRAHQYLHSDFDWFTFAFDSCDAAGDDTPRPVVHNDAAAIHAAVISLGYEAASCIVHYALMGEPPEPFDAFPQPCPPEVDRHVDRYERHMYMGRLVDVRIDIDDSWTEQVPMYIKERRVKRLLGYQAQLVEVPFCPIEWMPDPAWIIAMNGTFDAWRGYMVRLTESLSDVPFRSHRLSDLQLVA